MCPIYSKVKKKSFYIQEDPVRKIRSPLPIHTITATVTINVTYLTMKVVQRWCDSNAMVSLQKTKNHCSIREEEPGQIIKHKDESIRNFKKT